MPIYEYRCEECGQVSEFLIVGKQEPLHCKGCGESLKKLLSAHNTPNTTNQKFAEPGSGGCCGKPIIRHAGELLFGVGGLSSAPRQDRGKGKYRTE